MEKRMNRLAALASVAVLGFGAASCVEQEPSIEFAGSVVWEGSFEVDGANQLVSVDCAVEADPDSIDQVATRGTLNLQQFVELGGQIGPPLNTPIGHPSFEFWATMSNRLSNSTEVGAQGQGGGQGGYEGLNLDQNYIQVTGVEIRFPRELNNYPGGGGASSLNRTETFTVVLESAGGGAVLSYPIFTLRDVNGANPRLRNFYNSVAPDQQAIVPLVAEMQIIGETFAGTKVESNKFQYLIDICGECDPAEISTSTTCIPKAE